MGLGTAEKPIVFQFQHGPLDRAWDGVNVSGSVTFAHAYFRDALVALMGPGLIDVSASVFDGNDRSIESTGTLVLDGVKFVGKTSIGIMLRDRSSATITNSVFQGMRLDAIAHVGGTASIVNCTFNGTTSPSTT